MGQISVKIIALPGSVLSGNQHGLVSFQHDGSETTTASFDVTVEDGNEDSSVPVPSTFNVTVSAVNDPITAVPDTIVADEAVLGSLGGSLVANDTDDDIGDTKTIVNVVAGTGTTVTVVAGGFDVRFASGLVAHVASDGTYTLDAETLAQGQVAAGTFTYTVRDSGGAESSAVVDVTVTGDNDAPQVTAAVNATHSEADAPFTVNLLEHASDIDAIDVLNVSNLTLTGGDASGVTVNGDSLFVDTSAYQYLDPGDTAVITYSYDVIDGNGGSASQTASITIQGTNGLIIGTIYPDTLTGTEGADDIYGRGSQDTLYGRGGNDRLFGERGNDELYGEDGDDNIYGNSNDDILNGGTGADLIIGDAGNDVINGGTENDRLYGGTGDDQLFGGAGYDLLVGGPGIDRIDGGDGADRLYADSTADTFVFTGIAGKGDRVFDFVSGLHTLEINAAGFGGATGAFDFVSASVPVPVSGTQTFLYDTDNGKLFFDADGNGAGPLVHVLTLYGGPGLAATDILLV